MGLHWLIISLCIGIVITWFVRSIYRQRNLPHGPVPLPYFGNIISLAHDTHTTLNKLAHLYGPMFTIWFGSQPVIMVNDFSVALDVFSKNGLKFSARPNFISKVLTKGRTRLPFMNYSSKFLRNYGICRNACEVDESYLNECLSAVCTDFSEKIKSKLSSDHFDPANDIEYCVTRLLSRLIYGVEMDVKFSDINLVGDKNLLSVANSTNQFLLLRYIMMSRYLRYKNYIKRRDEICRKLFLGSMNNNNDATIASMILNILNEHSKEIDVMESETLCSDLFVFGVEDLCAAFRWMLLYFVTWPEIQLKVQAELDKMQSEAEIGKMKSGKYYFSVAESQSIPYLQAAVLETLRLSSLNPLSAIHVTTGPVTLRGFRLAKGTCVCVNLNTIHHSLKYWDNPYEFDPSRFLDATSSCEKLKDLDTIKGFLPFGSGVRRCFAAELTMKTLTTLMANLLYHFHFDISPWNMKTGLSPNTTRLVLVPNTYLVQVSKR